MKLPRPGGIATHPKVVAVGEIGLDYHYDHSPRNVQRDVFVEQMRIARDARKPIVIHTRTAWDDTIALLREHWAPPDWAASSIVSLKARAKPKRRWPWFSYQLRRHRDFPKATAIQEAARLTPADRLLIETDAPFLAPVPKRGKRNEPAYVVETARKLAELRGVTPDEIAQTTSDNWRRLVGRYGRSR